MYTRLQNPKTEPRGKRGRHHDINVVSELISLCRESRDDRDLGQSYPPRAQRRRAKSLWPLTPCAVESTRDPSRFWQKQTSGKSMVKVASVRARGHQRGSERVGGVSEVAQSGIAMDMGGGSLREEGEGMYAAMDCGKRVYKDDGLPGADDVMNDHAEMASVLAREVTG